MGDSKFINFSDKIFIAGHKGMVGKSVCRRFLKKGYKNLITCERKNLDLEVYSEVHDYINTLKPSVVVLCAAKVGGILANNNYPADFILKNLMIQSNVIKSSWNCGVKRFLFLGSSCIYPKESKQPIKEEYLLEGNLEKTNEFYAIAKIAGLKLCEALNKQYNFDTISLMPTNLYGTGDNYDLQNSHVLPALIRRFCEAKEKNLKSVTCWGDGSALREFLHCDDLGDACVYALENINSDIIQRNKEKTEKNINHINVGTGTDITIKELAEKISKLVGFKGDIFWDLNKPNGTHQKKLDISLMTRLGWDYKISLNEGLKFTIKEFGDKKF
tara:strand:+ start:682 stop:1668 length:987 start_codon:yes stop_codon:yes gene_type:complete